MEELKIRFLGACEEFMKALQEIAGIKPSEILLGKETEKRGLSFAGYREYTPSDDARFIDWKASIRSNKLLVKKFESLRNLNIMFLFDVSSSMMFGSVEKLKCEYAAEFLASLTYSALEFGSDVGLIMFNDKIVGEVFSDSRPEQFSLILNKLSNIELYGGNYSLGNALEYLQKSATEKTLVVIISDFIGLEKGWEDHLKIMSGNFNIMGVMIRDPIDYFFNFKSGDFAFGDPFSEKKIIIESKRARKAYEKNVKRIIMDIETNFHLANAYFLSLKTDEDFEDYLMKFAGSIV